MEAASQATRATREPGDREARPAGRIAWRPSHESVSPTGRVAKSYHTAGPSLRALSVTIGSERRKDYDSKQRARQNGVIVSFGDCFESPSEEVPVSQECVSLSLSLSLSLSRSCFTRGLSVR